MCGIAGYWDPRAGLSDGQLHAVGTAMHDAIGHRGPDGHAVWTDSAAGVALAHRRLAIVDLTPTGAQPMVSADGRWLIVYNGELYNTEDLRGEVHPGGFPWRGTSDTEVLLEAVATWGPERALQAANGMFALALWDRTERALILARDRMGIKPLLFGRVGGAWAFSSELKSFPACPGFSRTLDPEAMALVLAQGNVPAPLTIQAGIGKLMPGEMVVVTPAGDVRRHAWWSLLETARRGLEAPLAVSQTEAVDRAEALLADAVARQMVADVPLGAFLSGGIDSSTVVALMQQASTRRVRTFSIGFDVRDFDESAHAARVAAHLGTDHTELRVGEAEALAVVPRLAELFDEPFADSSQVPTYLVSRLTRGHVTVALSGDGGDELFGGYNRYVYQQRWGDSLERVPRPLRRAAGGVVDLLPADLLDGMLARVPGLPPQPATKLRKAADVMALDPHALYGRLVRQGADVAALCGRPAADVHAADPLGGRGGPVAAMQAWDQTGYMVDDVLTKVDRASMAVALEVRVPILDHRVVAFAWSLPMALKIRGGQGKWLLRQVLRRHVPDGLFERPKQGFAVPLAAWLRGPLRSWAEDLLLGPALAAPLERNAVRTLWAEHANGRRDNAHALWNVLMLEGWCRANGAA